ncbi:MAG: bifunctional pyr operon transcriptional regulator/uracil phosphoribosyltransferase PyrR [Saprospiraceae bacterium]|nr:bifunctional pyr operon transcriptional regulator/uracil phosphoribosyltransferase PyrR [Candidatus Opimibacter iunctus]
MAAGRIILSEQKLNLVLDRLTHQLIEYHGDFANSCIIGIQPRGKALSDRMVERLRKIGKLKSIEYGLLDVTFHRDDFRHRNEPLKASAMKMDFLVDGKKVILVDDVLYTGRTIQAAISALQHFGRPEKIELLVLIDRRFNRDLPIQSDYSGMVVDALDQAYVKVDWQEGAGGKVRIYASKEDVK